MSQLRGLSAWQAVDLLQSTASDLAVFVTRIGLLTVRHISAASYGILMLASASVQVLAPNLRSVFSLIAKLCSVTPALPRRNCRAKKLVKRGSWVPSSWIRRVLRFVRTAS